MSDRFLVAIGYHGNSFHGSQVQKDVGTVEGSLIQLSLIHISEPTRRNAIS